MNSKGKIIFSFLIIIAVAAMAVWFFNKPKVANAPNPETAKENTSQNNNPAVNSSTDTNTTQDRIVYYYGKSCPHCKNVAQFIEANGIDKKVSYTKKEFSDPAVTKEFLSRAEQCGINPSEAGVPLVFSGGKCYMGDVDVINFFKAKAGL
jgi:hypothetical protein